MALLKSRFLPFEDRSSDEGALATLDPSIRSERWGETRARTRVRDGEMEGETERNPGLVGMATTDWKPSGREEDIRMVLLRLG